MNSALLACHEIDDAIAWRVREAEMFFGRRRRRRAQRAVYRRAARAVSHP